LIYDTSAIPLKIVDTAPALEAEFGTQHGNSVLETGMNNGALFMEKTRL
jgi:hypothetical protein